MTDQVWMAATLFLALFIALRTIQKVLVFNGAPQRRSKLWLIFILGTIGIGLVVLTSYK